MGMGGSDSIIVGYKYYAGLHMVICEGNADIWAIKIGEKIAYKNTPAYPGTPSVGLTPAEIHINQPNLFGGEDREGGVVGYVDVLSGDPEQGQNAYLVSKLGPDIPAFRGVLSVVAKQCYLAAMNPYIKPWWFLVTRCPERHVLINLSNIGANPVGILREIIEENGLGEVEEESFNAAENYCERYPAGISLKLCIAWNGESVENFIQTILDHIGAILFVNPLTGKFRIAIPEYKESYNEHIINEEDVEEVISYQRTSLAETVNQITITYVEALSGEERSVVLQDVANINAQGKIVAIERKYPGIPTHELASYVAARELRAASSSLSKITLKVRRPSLNPNQYMFMYSLFLPGDVFKLYWPKLGLNGTIFRILEIDYGTPNDSSITIEAVEDIYSLKPSSYTKQQDRLWEDPVPAPVPAQYETAVELPYWEIRRRMTDGEFNAIPKNEGVGYLGTLARAPVEYNFGYRAYVDGTNFAKAEFCPTCFLDEDIGFLDNEITIAGGTSLNLAGLGDDKYAILGDEIIGVTQINNNQLRIKRGCLDTVARPHLAGEIIYFASDWYGLGSKEFIENENIDVKICTITGKGELPLSQAHAIDITFNARFDRPYPPAYPAINGVAYPEGAIFDNNPELNITWRHRNRILQTAYIVDHLEGNITPEEGVTYSVEIKHVLNNEVLFRQDGIEGTSITVPSLNVDGELIVRIWSVRDGFTSWQKQEFTIKYYVGNAPEEPEEPEENERLTEDGIQRITEDSAVRLVEAEVSEDVLYARYDEDGELRNTEENEIRRIEEQIPEGALFTRYTEENEIRLAENGVERRVEDQVTEDIIFARYDESGNERITEGGISRRVEDQVSCDIIFARYDESGNERITEGGISRRVEDQISRTNMFLRYTEGGDERCVESGDFRNVEIPAVEKTLFLRYNENGEERLVEEGEFRNIEYGEK